MAASGSTIPVATEDEARSTAVTDALSRLAIELDRTTRHLDQYVSRLHGEHLAPQDGGSVASTTGRLPGRPLR